jgi:hypothetical protein
MLGGASPTSYVLTCMLALDQAGSEYQRYLRTRIVMAKFAFPEHLGPDPASRAAKDPATLIMKLQCAASTVA